MDIFAELQLRAESTRDVFIEYGKKVAVEAAQDGADLVRERIHNAETEWGRSRVAAGKRPHPGRIETGEMLSAVGSRIVSEGDRHIETAYGWAPEDLQAYFMAQEHGVDGDRRIEPMNALAHSRDIVEDQVMGRLNGLR